jgi:hypothetical protein
MALVSFLIAPWTTSTAGTRSTPPNLIRLLLPRDLSGVRLTDNEVDSVEPISVSARWPIVVMRWYPNVVETGCGGWADHRKERWNRPPIREEHAVEGVCRRRGAEVGSRHGVPCEGSSLGSEGGGKEWTSGATFCGSERAV